MIEKVYRKCLYKMFIYVLLIKVLSNVILDIFNWYIIYNGIWFVYLDINGFFFKVIFILLVVLLEWGCVFFWFVFGLFEFCKN